MMFSNVLGSADEMDALVYGETHPNTLAYLQNQFSSFSQTLTEPARMFMERGRQVFEAFNGSEAMRFARNVVQRVLGSTEVQSDTIQSFYQLDQFQNAQPVMQRWLMANPTIRADYHKQLCDGFSSTYVDMEPGKIGDSHYDYRRVMDGVVQIQEDDWKIVEYFEELKEGDRHLLIEEKHDILNTWSSMDVLFAMQEDPTLSDDGSIR